MYPDHKPSISIHHQYNDKNIVFSMILDAAWRFYPEAKGGWSVVYGNSGDDLSIQSPSPI